MQTLKTNGNQMMVSVAVMVVGLSSHIHNGGRDRQNGRVLVFNELGDPLADDIEEQDKPDDDEQLHIFLLSMAGRSLTHRQPLRFPLAVQLMPDTVGLDA